jgi:hypothetical protein
LIIIEVDIVLVLFSPRNEAMDCCQVCSLIQDARLASVLSRKVPRMLHSLQRVIYFCSSVSFIGPGFCPTILSTSDR